MLRAFEKQVHSFIESQGLLDSAGRILLAVSATSDPNGTWYYFSINSNINISGTNYWADYPGFAVDNNAIYITNNLFSYSATGGVYGGNYLWIVPKTPFYTGGTPTFAVYDPPGLTGQQPVTMQPAHMFGTVQPNVGTFLVRYSGFTAANM